ncbi:Transcriptional regulatory protein rxt2 [Neolecta irregularis DAH-3]|uniref:Transcriptional regulatory protein rxt2 n=1 Tax=Neolecta irregularis (strain DAH-3) TaxID=1198029 RepID=A0A1U7LUL1_NEOID|nr:Transcriptional regulatory protein rxt2 [Neolecta irregularis DAH-3]|eukprot:OLL26365.1 Transcriptional regulatory protein rxt2 [Neolecta irregularis DAH-3]
MANPLLDHRSIAHIASLKAALARDNQASDSDDDIHGYLLNRGNKLKKHASLVHGAKLRAARGLALDREVVQYQGHSRSIIARNTDDCQDPSDWPDDDPYTDIHIKDLFKQVSTPSEIHSHPTISKTFAQNKISLLADQTHEMITSAHADSIRLTNLYSTFLNDDPGTIMSSFDSDQENISERVMRLYYVKPRENTQEEEELKSLARAGLERCDEFVRIMERVRMNLLKAERLKNQIWNSSEEEP